MKIAGINSDQQEIVNFSKDFMLNKTIYIFKKKVEISKPNLNSLNV